MRRKIYLFASLVAFTVPALGFAAENSDFQEGQTSVQEMRGYFEGRKAAYRQYLADLEIYNQAVIAQQQWDDNRINEDQMQQRIQASLQATINQQQCSQYRGNAKRQCLQLVSNMQTQMAEQSEEYAAYRRDRAWTRPVVGRQPIFYDNTNQLHKAYVFNEGQMLQERINLVGERNMTDENGNRINNNGETVNYYNRNYSTHNDANAGTNAWAMIEAQVE